MISFFKLAIGVVLLVMVMIWFCSYLRRGRHREPWLRPPSVTTPPPPYTVHGGSNNASALGLGLGHHPSLMAFPGCTAPPAVPPARPAPPFVAPPSTLGVGVGHALRHDDLPPPYHTVVNVPPPLPPPSANNNNFVPPPYQPPYDGLGKTTSGPT